MYLDRAASVPLTICQPARVGLWAAETHGIHPLITKTEELAKPSCERLRPASPSCAVDTEFMRENTYWPELCLIQVGEQRRSRRNRSEGGGIDLKPLLDLFVNNEDVLEGLPRRRPGLRDRPQPHRQGAQPLFDTQIAAMALGHGEQIGYSNLIESLLGHSLDKGARFTDWSRRPLDKRQIEYAIADVTHLATDLPAHGRKAGKTGRGALAGRGDGAPRRSSSFAFPPEDAWKRLRLPSRNRVVLGRLQGLAAWRETEARYEEHPSRPDRQGRHAE